MWTEGTQALLRQRPQPSQSVFNRTKIPFRNNNFISICFAPGKTSEQNRTDKKIKVQLEPLQEFVFVVLKYVLPEILNFLFINFEKKEREIIESMSFITCSESNLSHS